MPWWSQDDEAGLYNAIGDHERFERCGTAVAAQIDLVTPSRLLQLRPTVPSELEVSLAGR
jgi:hypothetical protein